MLPVAKNIKFYCTLITVNEVQYAFFTIVEWK